MSKQTRLFTLMILTGLLAGYALPLDAQIGRIRDRARQEIEGRAGTGSQTQQPQTQPADAQEQNPSATPASPTAAPGEGAWANYDFVPGERILFADDFSRDRVGNFPQRFEFNSGNMEIVEWQGKRWLRGEKGVFFINLPETLPERFTMEFDLAGWGNAMELSFVNDRPGHDQRLEIGTWFARVRSGNVDGQGELGVKTEQGPVRIHLDRRRLPEAVRERAARAQRSQCESRPLEQDPRFHERMEGRPAADDRGSAHRGGRSRALRRACGRGPRGHAGDPLRHRQRPHSTGEHSHAEGDHRHAPRASGAEAAHRAPEARIAAVPGRQPFEV
jgi:hypothetical protein